MRPLQLVWAVFGVFSVIVMVLFTDEASCESARKTIAEFMKKNGRSFKNAPDENGAKSIDPVCVRNPDKIDRGAPTGSDIFEHGGRLRSDKGSD